MELLHCFKNCLVWCYSPPHYHLCFNMILECACIIDIPVSYLRIFLMYFWFGIKSSLKPCSVFIILDIRGLRIWGKQNSGCAWQISFLYAEWSLCEYHTGRFHTVDNTSPASAILLFIQANMCTFNVLLTFYFATTGCLIEVWEGISNFVPHGCDYLSTIGLKLIIL